MGTPAREYWTKAVDTVTDTWNYFRDRSRILKTSGAAATVQGALRNSPFKFAILSIIVPTLFVDGGIGIYKTFRDLPPCASPKLRPRLEWCDFLPPSV